MKSCNSPRMCMAKVENFASRAKTAICLTGFAAFTACATGPDPSVNSAQPAPTIVSMDEWMARGNSAIAEGDHTKARDDWRSAAKDYPTAKQPWLKLSEDYFNTGDYGNAVLAAQEALQRDPHDRLANSVLAVSGLRLTAGSLAALRDSGNYGVGSRDEAVAVTRQLREALGEPVLVSPSGSSAAHKRPVRPRPSARPSAASNASPAATTPSTTAPATAPLGPVGLDKLK